MVLIGGMSAAHSQLFHFDYSGAGITASGTFVYTADSVGGTASIDRNGVQVSSYTFIQLSWQGANNYYIAFSYLINGDRYNWLDYKNNGLNLVNNENINGGNPPAYLTSGDVYLESAPAPTPGAGLLAFALAQRVS